MWQGQSDKGLVKPIKEVLEAPDAWGSSPCEKVQLFSWKHTLGVLAQPLFSLAL